MCAPLTVGYIHTLQTVAVNDLEHCSQRRRARASTQGQQQHHGYTSTQGRQAWKWFAALREANASCVLVYNALHGLASQYLTYLSRPVSSVIGRSGLRCSAVVHASWPHRRLNSNKLRTTILILCCVRSISMEPAAIRHQEPSIAAVVHIRTLDLSLICMLALSMIDTTSIKSCNGHCISGYIDTSLPCNGCLGHVTAR